jgi:signal peptidase II
MNRILKLLGVSVTVVVLDQLSKTWVENRLADGSVIHLVGSLQFSLGYNSGMAWSTGTGFGPYIGLLATVVVVALLVSLRRVDNPLSATGVSLVIGGALGNVCDRMFRGTGWMHGRVIDFIDLKWFPAFNVADSAISVGAILLVLTALIDSRRTNSAPESAH